MATILAEPTVDDGVLQVTGAAAIYVDYPVEFKREFKDQLPQIEVIRIASDAVFDAASLSIKDQKKETVTEQLARESEDAEQDQELRGEGVQGGLRCSEELRPEGDPPGAR